MFQTDKSVTCLSLVLAVFLLVCLACSPSSQDAPGLMTPEELEAEAQVLDERLICPSCPGKTIGQAQVAQAAQMRLLVREKLAEGWTRQEILDYFAERYEGVLAEPPKEGFALLAWVLPLAGIAGGAGIVYLVIRSMRRRGGPQSPDADLDRYLDRVDRDLRHQPGADGGPVMPPPDSGDI